MEGGGEGASAQSRQQARLSDPKEVGAQAKESGTGLVDRLEFRRRGDELVTHAPAPMPFMASGSDHRWEREKDRPKTLSYSPFKALQGDGVL